jgi:hypothetical protein
LVNLRKHTGKANQFDAKKHGFQSIDAKNPGFRFPVLLFFPNKTNPKIEHFLQEWTHMHPIPPIRFPFISKMQMLYKAVPQFVS